ncbi:18277_t:CDS:2, partial [Acaulospora morrowiae]
FAFVFVAFLVITSAIAVLSPILIPFAGLFILLKVMETFRTVEDNPPETLQTLLMYEKNPGQAQRFLGENFRWPSSMPECHRRDALVQIADVDLEFDDDIGFNLIFFYNALDRGEFSGHENEWATVYNQRVVEYGQQYNDEQLNSVLEAMPSAIQLPVDQTRLPRSKPAKMVVVQRTNNGGDYKYTSVIDTGAPETISMYVKHRLGWSTASNLIAGGYGAPARQVSAPSFFE